MIEDTDTRPVAVARTTDPETSHDAAASVTDLARRHSDVLKLFRIFGAMTDDTLVTLYEHHANEGRLVFQSPSSIRTRRAELVRLGRLRFTGSFKIMPLSNRRARLWGMNL